MSKLYARFGTMKSSKSANLLMVAKNYELQNKEIITLTSETDNRNGVGFITTRAGIEKRQCDAVIGKDDSVVEIFDKILKEKFPKTISCILVDECQFLSQNHIQELAKIVDNANIPVICYGLKTDFKGRLFDGSKRLIELADSIEEIKNTCQFCNKKATMNLRTVNNIGTDSGEQIQIGDTEYHPVCREHYFRLLNVDVSMFL